MKYAAIDVGTTSVKMSVYEDDMRRRESDSVKVNLSEEGTHDPVLLLDTVRRLVRKAKDLGAGSFGIACYRASFLAWDKRGRPLSSILTWLSKESSNLAYESLPFYVRLAGKLSPLNLIINANSPAMRYLSLYKEMKSKHSGEVDSIMIWTLDSFIAFSLTGRYISDATNSTLTGLIDPSTFKPISPVISLLSIKPNIPEIVSNTEFFGVYEGLEFRALSADQQAACIGEKVLSADAKYIKVTNGTGTFVDIPVEKYKRAAGLIPIVIFSHKGEVQYGLEGYLPSSGSALDLLFRLGVVHDYSELEEISYQSEGALFIPSLFGLQIPNHPDAKGLITGITQSTSSKEIVGSLFKSIAFTVRLVLERSGRADIRGIRADGKLSKSSTLLKLISSCTSLPVERYQDVEATQRGLAILQKVGITGTALEDVEIQHEKVELIKGEMNGYLEEEYRRWKKVINWLKSYPLS